MQLALGTVQFGQAYGIAGKGHAVPAGEVRRILAAAWASGVRTLDTAAAYGDIEQRLATLCGTNDFRIISKVPAIADSLSPTDAAAWAVGNARQSRERLGDRLVGLMCHKADDLLGERGFAVFDALSNWAQATEASLGASCYDPATLLKLRRHLGITLAQLPGNALDQRLPIALTEPLAGVEVHLRSAFLQGLLLMDEEAGIRRLPGAKQALRRWHAWCAARGLSPLIGALSVVKGFAAVSTVVIGVETLIQFEEIALAWNCAAALSAPELTELSAAVIDPRLWKL